MSTSASKERHDAMVSHVVHMMKRGGFEGTKANLPDSEERPEMVLCRDEMSGYTPDLTGTRDGRHHLIEVKTDDELTDATTREQVRLFASHADSEGAEFSLVVPKGCGKAASKILEECGVFANVIPVELNWTPWEWRGRPQPQWI